MTSSPLFLTIDFGSQSVRAHIIDKHGHSLVHSQRSNLTYLQPKEGQVEQRADWFYTQLCICSQNLIKQAKLQKIDLTDLNAMAITCMRNTIICLDKNNKPLLNAIVWNDTREATSVPILPWYMRMFSTFASVFVPIKATIVNMQRAAFINYIYEHHRSVWKQIEHLLLLSGYLNYKITENYVDSNASIIAYLPFNYKRQQWRSLWSWQYKAIAVKPKWLPKLRKLGSAIGQVSGTSQKNMGLDKPLTLFAVAADKACEVLGSGCYQNNQIHISLGTAVSITLLSNKFIAPKRFYPAYPSAQPNKYLTEFMLPFGLAVITNFITLKSADFEFLTLDQNRKMSLENLIELYIKVNQINCEGLVFDLNKLDHDHDLESGFIGLTGHNVFQQYLSITTSIVNAITNAVEQAIRSSEGNVSRVYVGGGGAKSDRILQAIANNTELEVYKPKISEVGVLGVAISLAINTGVYNNYEDAMAAMGPDFVVFKPNVNVTAKVKLDA